jgi:small subunit ribosomal protein S7e
MSAATSKVVKKNAETTDFEKQVAAAFQELESQHSGLREDLKQVFIASAIQFQATFREQQRRAILITLHYKSQQSERKIHSTLVAELEKRFKLPVVIVFQRTILPKFLKMKGQQRRPRSRTLTAVHDAILEDILFPFDILGRRMRVKVNGNKIFKVLLDPKDRSLLEDKCETLAAVYRTLTNKEVVFEFPQNREFPN